MNMRFIKIPAVMCVLLMLCACGKVSSNQNNEHSGYYTTTAPSAIIDNFYTEQVELSAPETNMTISDNTTVVETTVAHSDTETQQPVITQEASETTQEIISQTTEKVYEKTGEMAFSDSSDNKFIVAVSDKYAVDSKNLVALFTVPENDGNIVLEFDGSTDSNGKLIRNDSTLIAIYSVDKNLNSKRASEDRSLNEYSYGEMKVMFISTTKYIMPEFQDQLNG